MTAVADHPAVDGDARPAIQDTAAASAVAAIAELRLEAQTAEEMYARASPL